MSETRVELRAEAPALQATTTPGAEVRENQRGGWVLSIPSGEAGAYRLAQLDDYKGLPRRRFPWQPPLRLSLRARASSDAIAGTWGFGLWNNPFGMGVFSGAEMLRLPVLPNAAWFFFAPAPVNYLSLRDDLPGHGDLAATFRAPRVPGALLLPGALGLPLLALPPAVRLMRRLARTLVRESAVRMEHDVTGWHHYSLLWERERVVHEVDGQVVASSECSPLGPLGLVLWVDNQWAALRPGGSVGMGTLPTPEPAWIEIEGLVVTRGG